MLHYSDGNELSNSYLDNVEFHHWNSFNFIEEGWKCNIIEIGASHGIPIPIALYSII